MKTSTKIILFSIALGFGFWILDSIIDVVFFSSESFIDELILSPSTYEIYIRSLGLVFITILGVIVSMTYSKRRKVEERLRDSEERLNQTQQFSKVGGWEWDINTNRLEWSDEMFRLFGLDRNDFNGDINDVITVTIHPDDRDKVFKMNESVAKGGTPVPLDYRVVWPDGSVHVLWAQAGNIVLDDENKPSRLSGYAQDITERKNAEEAATRANEFNRSILENAPYPIVIQDTDTAIRYVNPTLEQLTGYSSSELVGTKAPYIYWTEEATQKYLKAMKEGFEGGAFLKVEAVLLKKKTGEPLWIEASAAPVKNFNGQIENYVSVWVDITERKRIQEALLETNNDLKIAQRLTQIGNWKWNLSDDKVTWSEELCRINAWDIAAPVPPFSKMDRFYTRESWEKLTCLVTKALNTGEAYEVELDQITNDGVSINTFARGEADLDVEGKVIGLHGTVQDITERKKIENIIKTSEERYRTLVATSPDGIVLIGLDGKLTFASRQTLEIFGYDDENEILGHSPLDWIEENSRLEAQNTIKNVLNGGYSSTNQYQLVKKDGKRFWAEIHSSTVKGVDGKPTGMVALLRDITERKQAELALQQSEEKFRSLAEQTPNMVFINQNGRVVYANRQCELITGYSREEFYALDFDFMTLIAPEYRDMIKTMFRKHMNSEEVPPYDYALSTKDGERVDVILATKLVDYDGKPAIIGIMTDITERKKTEETLRMQAELLDGELDSVYVHDFEGNFAYFNKAAYISHGYTRDELYRMNLSQIDEPDSARLISTRMKEIVETGKATFNVNHRHKNGSLIPMEIHASLIEIGGKKMIMSVAHDIAERRKIQEQLMAQDRLASIGQLVSGVAHEINNPLTSVIGFSELLLQRDLSDDVKADLSIISDEAQRTARIVKNLLTFARKQPEGKVSVDVNEQLQRVIDLRNHEQNVNNIKVIFKAQPHLPKVMGNASQLQQVFFNIIVNAEQAMQDTHGRGTITITTERKGDIVRISLADDGPGIAPENMGRLFTPFFTTKQIGKGTGLGLSICHGIITEHGGKIWAESELGKGSEFIVELPIKVI